MSSLSTKDSLWFEQLLNMNTGWVLNFNDRTFHAFVLNSVNVDIESEKYANVGSKAKRLRHFWKIENDFLTQKLLSDLLVEWYEYKDLYDQFSEQELKLLVVDHLRKNNIPFQCFEKET